MGLPKSKEAASICRELMEKASNNRIGITSHSSLVFAFADLKNITALHYYGAAILNYISHLDCLLKQKPEQIFTLFIRDGTGVAHNSNQKQWLLAPTEQLIVEKDKLRMQVAATLHDKPQLAIEYYQSVQQCAHLSDADLEKAGNFFHQLYVNKHSSAKFLLTSALDYLIHIKKPSDRTELCLMKCLCRYYQISGISLEEYQDIKYQYKNESAFRNSLKNQQACMQNWGDCNNNKIFYYPFSPPLLTHQAARVPAHQPAPTSSAVRLMPKRF
jgi:hypothetical protein